MDQQDSQHFLKVDQVGTVAVARFTREVVLTGMQAESSAEHLIAILTGPGKHQLLLDCANVGSLSSLMLTKLILLNRAAATAGGRLALCNVRPAIGEIFQITRLIQILAIYPGEAEALQSF